MRNSQRDNLARMANFLIGEAARIDYVQRRPMQLTRLSFAEVERILRSGGRITGDCSESVTALFKWAGCKDPNGNNYNGSGFTGTMLAHLPHYSDPARAHVGALCVWGGGSGEHVAMVIQRNGSNPIMFSHGGTIGPLRISLDVESSFHRGVPRTFLDVGHL